VNGFHFPTAWLSLSMTYAAIALFRAIQLLREPKISDDLFTHLLAETVGYTIMCSVMAIAWLLSISK